MEIFMAILILLLALSLWVMYWIRKNIAPLIDEMTWALEEMKKLNETIESDGSTELMDAYWVRLHNYFKEANDKIYSLYYGTLTGKLILFITKGIKW